MNDESKELLPCPFCGGNGEFKYRNGSQSECVYIQCKNCGVKTKEIYASVDYCAADEVAKLWNLRMSRDNNKKGKSD